MRRKEAEARQHGAFLERVNRSELRKQHLPKEKLHVPKDNEKEIWRNIQPPIKMDKM